MLAMPVLNQQVYGHHACKHLLNQQALRMSAMSIFDTFPSTIMDSTGVEAATGHLHNCAGMGAMHLLIQQVL